MMIEFFKSLFLPKEAENNLISCKFRVCPNCKFRVLGNLGSCKTCGFNLKKDESNAGLTSGSESKPLSLDAKDHIDSVCDRSLGHKAKFV